MKQENESISDIDIKKKKILYNYPQMNSSVSAFAEGISWKLKAHLLPLSSLSPPPQKKKKSDYGVRAILMILTDQLEKFR